MHLSFEKEVAAEEATAAQVMAAVALLRSWFPEILSEMKARYLAGLLAEVFKS